MTGFQKARRSTKLSAGLSLVELLIAMVITLTLLAGVTQIYLSSKLSHRIQHSMATMQENGRFALETISASIRNAGNMGGLPSNAYISGLVPASPDQPCTPHEWPRQVTQRVAGSNDSTGFASGCIASRDYLAGDVLAVHTTVDVTHDELKGSDGKNTFYLRVAGATAELLRGIPAAGTTFDTPRWSDRRVHAEAFFVGPARDAGKLRRCTATNHPIPALHRLRLTSGGRLQREELVAGVENFQIRFGVDSDGDGAFDQYRDPDQVDNWQQVVAARIWILVRADCPDGSGYQNTHRYRMGDATFSPRDSFRRQLYTTTVVLRNGAINLEAPP